MVSHSFGVLLVLLSSEWPSFCKSCFSSYSLSEDRWAANTQNYLLCMARDHGDVITSWAFCIHKVGTGLGNRCFLCFLISSWEEWRRSCVRDMLLWEVITAKKAFIPTFKCRC
jgi:hypothetical protein